MKIISKSIKQFKNKSIRKQIIKKHLDKITQLKHNYYLQLPNQNNLSTAQRKQNKLNYKKERKNLINLMRKELREKSQEC